ncbi:pentapeptide repeat-containing protein [Streptomyces sp. YS415]|uniref:pentapeptide repeat-containing protein n=1 Tax=Streptomyces sp. YS415 TaxID=2944806 RepID=UPI0020224359|nr:pentapeptide repeat-containing protein [Streptomyces sp. YS415]MCL7430369.1 pentapeptide repeat-containing protein [Streptomyces sp. YS415]
MRKQPLPLEKRRARAQLKQHARRWGLWALILAGACILLGVLPWLIWQGPYRIDAAHLDEAELKKGSAALVTGLRTAVVAFAAALGAGIALLYTARTYRLTRRGQITDRFTKALERLGSDEVYVRIGGILALEQIVQDAPEQAATDAARVLGHFIRERAPKAASPPNPDDPENHPQSEPLPDEPAADIQAALTALTRAESRTHVDPREPLDLHGLHLTGAQLTEADLTRADLHRATLTKANLNRATLTRADLTGATLTKAHLTGATLTRADLRGATLTDADLHGTTLTRADLTGATLTDADLRGATLTKAFLGGAMLTKAFLGGATLTDAFLTGATLTDAFLTGATLTKANLTGATLTKAHLHRATLTKADLTGATLTDADLGRATLTKANLHAADLSRAIGLTPMQVASAYTSENTKLPANVATSIGPVTSEN